MHCEKPIILPITLTGLFLFIALMFVSAGKCSLPFCSRWIFAPTSEVLAPHAGIWLGFFDRLAKQYATVNRQVEEKHNPVNHFSKMQVLKWWTLLGAAKQGTSLFFLPSMLLLFCLLACLFWSFVCLFLFLPPALLKLLKALPWIFIQVICNMLWSLGWLGQKEHIQCLEQQQEWHWQQDSASSSGSRLGGAHPMWGAAWRMSCASRHVTKGYNG